MEVITLLSRCLNSTLDALYTTKHNVQSPLSNLQIYESFINHFLRLLTKMGIERRIGSNDLAVKCQPQQQQKLCSH